ncbi:MAG TPA: hypothetical protein VH349_12160 [Ktedonobacterales bacterium]
MRQSKELTPSPEQAAEVTADVTTQARRAGTRKRKAPVTIPISAALPAEATADLKGTHLPPQETVTSAKSTQTATSLRTLSAMHPQLRSASGSHARPSQPQAPPLPPATSPAPRSTPMPVEETPDLALGRAWRYPIAPQPLSAPLSGPRKGAPSRPQVTGKVQAALSAFHLWVTNAPRPMVIEWAAVAQATLALLGALVFASLALGDDLQALQALVFASLAGIPAGVSYALASRRSLALLGALALVASQVALFAWSFALVGPRPALLLLAPALIVVAMEMSGKALGVVMALGLGAVYVWFALIPAHGDMMTASLDLIAILVGLAAVCAALLALYQRITTAEAHAKDWRAEAERLDALNQAQRTQAEEEASYLRATLAEALLGRGVVRVALDGPLAKLAEMVYTVASRLMTLRRDRDERVRLEGALAQLMRAVEDSSLGGRAQWPRQTGTPVDTLSDQLRSASSWTPESQDNLLARDLFAAPPAPSGSESNIRYLFPRASGSHPRGV